MRTSVGAGLVAGLACAVLLVVWVGTELPEWAETLGVGRSVARVSAESPVREAAAGETLSYGFDSDTAGHLPAGFHTALTGRGTPGRWEVAADTSAPSKPNVLAQLSTDRTDYRFPLAILDAAAFRDLDLRVTFKAISGTVDQGAGLVFRLQDANNYYVVRANALENNVNLYRVVDGRRREIAGAALRVSSGAWHEIRVEAAGDRITCDFEGVRRIETTDRTFTGPGKVGMWTKADSVIYFDTFHVAAK